MSETGAGASWLAARRGRTVWLLGSPSSAGMAGDDATCAASRTEPIAKLSFMSVTTM